jgi:protocatechuate 3,4-dioxygenase beta subunit
MHGHKVSKARNRTLFLSVALLVVSMVAPTLSLASSGGEKVRAAETSWSISGVVTGDVNPSGVEGVSVYLYESDSPAGWLDYVKTGPDGSYKLEDISAGTYKICFSPGSGMNYAEEWWDDKGDFDAADGIEVVDANITGINALLDSGSISGKVTSPSETEGVKDVDVYAYDANHVFAGSAVTDSEGKYSIKNLRTGNYFLYAYPWLPNTNNDKAYAYEWFDDKDTFEEATAVAVVLGEETTGKNFSLESGSISGTVTGEGGGTLASVDVYVHDPDFHLVGTARTASDGEYVVRGVRPGTYAVYFDPTYIREELGQDYCGEYYQNEESFFDADPVVVASDITGIDAQLEAGGYIEGRVTSDGVNGIENVYVYAYHAGDSTYWVSEVKTDPDGKYRISGLAPGDYKVSFNHSSGQNYLDEWYDDKGDFYSAGTLNVARGGGNSNIDAVLGVGGTVSGKVVGSDAPGGLEGVQVRVLDENYGFVGGTLTKAGGNYSVRGLPSGQYYVEFYTGEEINYQGEFYNDRPQFKDADPVKVTAGGDTFLDDAVLLRYGSISGRVTSAAYPGGMEGIGVNVYSSSGPYCSVFTWTDSSGYYSVNKLAGGEYRVMFTTSSFNERNGTDYAEEYYNDKPTYHTSEKVQVIWGSNTPGIDAQMERRGRITGRVTGGTPPQGIGNAWVMVYDLSNNFVTNKYPAGDGYYSVPLKPGSYKLYFYNWVTGLVNTKWYKDKDSFDTADPVMVNEGQTVSGIDCYYPPPTPAGFGSISGHITSDSNPTGQGFTNVYVYYSSTSAPIYKVSVNADGNGDYKIDNLEAGLYKVLFRTSFGNDSSFKWYEDKGSFNSATEVEVKAGEETAGIGTHFQDSQLSLSGRVTGEGASGGIHGAWIDIYDISGDFGGLGPIYLGYGSTDQDGYYYFYGLAPGEYKLKFGQSDAYYLWEWYENEGNYASADHVTVPVSNLDVQLEKGGKIKGKVTSASYPGGVPYIWVYLYDLSGNYINSCLTNSNGDYISSALPPGKYKVKFLSLAHFSEYIPRWYDGKPDLTSADEVKVTAGEDTTVNGEVLEYGSISGQVTGAENPTGVGGVEVYLYKADNAENWVARTTTNSEGRYQFTWNSYSYPRVVEPGNYKVCFSPVSGMNYTEEWWDNKSDFADASIIEILSGEDETSVDAYLEPGGSISGQVASRSAPGGIEGVGVYAYTPDGDYARAGKTDANGDYVLPSLATGDYKVFFETFDMPYKDEWYNDKYDLESADIIHVVSGEDSSEKDVMLQDSGSISGRVTSDKEPDGVVGVYVHAYPENDPWRWAGFAQTRGDGTYVIEGLVPGKYKVILNSSSGQNYKSVWYNAKSSFEDADTVTVEDRINTGNIDCRLSEYGTIEGRVTGGDGKGIEGIEVRFHKVGAGPGDENLAPSITDANGDYTRPGLDAGQYKVEFRPPWGSPYLKEWYDDEPSQEQANVIDLGAGEKEENVGAVLSDAGAPKVTHIIPQKGVDTAPLEDVHIFGTGFAKDGYTLPSVLLYKDGMPFCEARNVRLNSSGEIICDFNFAGQPGGLRDVMVVNPNGQGGRLVDGFEVIHKPKPPTIFGPAAADVGDVRLHGQSEAGTRVKILKKPEGGDEWSEAAEVVTNEFGNWYATVNLTAGNYQFYAKAYNETTASEASSTISVFVKEKSDLAVLEDYKAILGGNTYYPDIITGIIYLPAFRGQTIEVKVKFSSPPEPSSLALSFAGNNYTSFSGPDTAGYYTVELTGWSWVPGMLQGTLSWSDEGKSFQQIILEVRLIDPSGYVYDAGTGDASTGQRVQGAKATLQYFFDGAWQEWPASEYGQVNPQYTDDEGKYGWDVHPGDFRVLVEKAGYQATVSPVVTIPPPVTDLYIGVFRNLPVINSLSSNQGEVGTQITITGSDFGGAPGQVIFFNEKPAPIVSWTETSITCTVPSGALSGNVVVETNSGRSNGVYFTVIIPGLPAPVISGVNPAQGEVGSAVTITGNNFGGAPGQVIFFNEKPAPIISWSDTSITCTVPEGAQSGNVVVQTAAGRSNGFGFTVLPAAKPAEAAKTWYLAEGSTAGGMETWVLVQNPGDDAVTVTLKLQTDQGEKTFPALTDQTIPPRSRVSYPIHQYIQTFNVSTLVTATGEVVCERAMYGNNKAWAHDSVGYCKK